MSARNMPKGESHYAARLTEDDVRAIRAAYATPCACGRTPSLASLANRYGVTAVQVHHIVKRRAWAHIA